MDAQIYISKEGLEKAKQELEYLKKTKRREVADRIEKAKDLGDLRENAEYHDAKEESGFVEGRIIELEDLVNRATVIAAGSSDAVTVGANVKVRYDGKEKTFTIVGSAEADPVKGYISNESPLGRALLGKKVGEHAEVNVPAGKIRYVIASIN